MPISGGFGGVISGSLIDSRVAYRQRRGAANLRDYTTGRATGMFDATPNKTKHGYRTGHTQSICPPLFNPVPEVARIVPPIFRVVKELRFQIKRSS
jgi:hypothetical protein